LLALAQQLARDFPDAEYWGYPVLLVHGDWHPANVRYLGDTISGVFDLDWATRQPKLVDLADGVAYFAGCRPGGLDAGDIRTLTRAYTLDRTRVRLFLRGYLGAGRLHPEELRALPKFLLARWLYSRVDPMRRKIPVEEAVDYLLEGIWGPVAGIRALHVEEAWTA
jgi:Ser/Thr protein kinase RdoA (MazF antagonist)